MTPPETQETSTRGGSSPETNGPWSTQAPHGPVDDLPGKGGPKWSRFRGHDVRPLQIPHRASILNHHGSEAPQDGRGPRRRLCHNHCRECHQCELSKDAQHRRLPKPISRPGTGLRMSNERDTLASRAHEQTAGNAQLQAQQELQSESESSPCADSDSETDCEDHTYDTPLTSPCTSPTKPCPQLDGPATRRSEQSSSEPCTPSRSVPRTPVQRHPSALLKYCEHNATPRQRRLIAGTLQSPDRFIPGRASTPTKEALRLHKPRPKRNAFQQPLRRDDELPDPFGSTPSPSARVADGFATIRRTHQLSSVAFRRAGTVVPDAVAPARRAVSAGAVWTVGGTAVTEGVASITNGRGGRSTSGTNAPHYTSDFLRKPSPSEEEVQHARRLAIAMDVNPTAKMLPQSSPSSPASPSTPRRSSDISPKRTIWNDGKWEKEPVSTRESLLPSFFAQRLLIPRTATKPQKRKPKEIPMIPFRGTASLPLQLLSFDFQLTVHSSGRSRFTRRLLLLATCILTHDAVPCSWSGSACLSMV